MAISCLSIFEIGAKIESSFQEIDSKFLHDPDRLQCLVKELSQIIDQIQNLNLQTDLWESYRSKAVTLIGRCYNLMIDSQVTQFAEEAKILSECKGPEGIAQKIEELKEKIHNLLYHNALSLENRKMIRMANCYLKRAKDNLTEGFALKNNIAQPEGLLATALKKSKVVSFNEELLTDEERHDLAESLYDIAGLFYEGRVKEGFSKYQALPQLYRTFLEKERCEIRDDLKRIMEASNVNFSNLMQMIKWLVFLAERSAGAQMSSVPPNDAEVHQVFGELSKLS